MPSIEGIKTELTFENFLLIVAGVLLVLGVLKAIVSGVEAWKKISLRDRVKTLESDVKDIKHRLDVSNKKFTAQGEDMGQILQTLNALQVHFITGNDHEKLRQSNDELVEYMNKRAQRDAEQV